MNVSKNGYYHWLKTKDLRKQKASLIHLKERIIKIFDSSNQVYGCKRIQKSLEREGLHYSVSYISLLMKSLGLKSVICRKFKVTTTNSNHSYPVWSNRLNRNFSSKFLGEKWVSDITYIKVGNKWNYLTTIIDLADRKVVAWTLSKNLTTENTIYKTWIKARSKRSIAKNHIFHSDRGIQYASNTMKLIFSKSSYITQSMSRRGNCWDNAVAESFFKTIKYECTNRYEFKTFLQAYDTIKEYISWYNTKRLHSALNYKTPLEIEIEYYNKLNKIA